MSYKTLPGQIAYDYAEPPEYPVEAEQIDDIEQDVAAALAMLNEARDRLMDGDWDGYATHYQHGMAALRAATTGARA